MRGEDVIPRSRRVENSEMSLSAFLFCIWSTVYTENVKRKLRHEMIERSLDFN